MGTDPQPDHYRTRETDPPGTDPRARRVVDPRFWDFEAAYGKAALRARGWFAAIVTIGALVIVTNFYLGWRVEQVVTKALASSSVEHGTLVDSSRETNCILTMTPEERIQFRGDLRPDAWSRWCWWIRRRTEGGGGS